MNQRFRVSYGIAFLVLGILTIGVGLAFWSGAFRARPAMTSLPTPTATLVTAIGDVRVERGGEEREVENGFTLAAGDVVRTGEASAASIVFFWSARAELDAGSELRIVAAAADAADPAKQDIRLALIRGRVWSRVLKLLDPESRYGVEYNNVVATVRGTAYAVTGRGTQATVDVFDGLVGVDTGALSAPVPEGFTAIVDTTGTTPPRVIPTPDETVNETWIQRMLDEDAAFGRNVMDQRTFLGADAVAESAALQQDADSGVLRDPGVEHSGFLRVDIVSPEQRAELGADTPLALRAYAVFVTPNGEIRREVTDQAAWQVSRPDLASVDRGVVRLLAQQALYGTQVVTEATLFLNGKPLAVGSGTSGLASEPVRQEVVVVARWHDGTHSHSGSIVLSAP